MLTALVSGKLIADPKQRTGQSGKPYALARLIAPQDAEEDLFVSAIAFGSTGEALAQLRKGDAICAVGRAGVTMWTDRATGAPRSGLRVVVDSLLTPYQLALRRQPRAADETAEQASQD
jgi:single-stranded DNA-binding protein